MQIHLTSTTPLTEFTTVDIRKEDIFPSKTGLFAVIPAFNEAHAIGSTILLTRQHVDRVIVIDDGSSDNTADIARSAGADVIRLDCSTGRAYALLLGLRRAREQRCTMAVSLDASGQYDPREIERVTGKIQIQEADLVIGSRYLNREEPLSAFEKYDRMTLSSGMVVTDSTSSFLAFSRKALVNLDFPSDGFRLNRDLIVSFDRHDLRISEVPVSFHTPPVVRTSWGFPAKVIAGMPAFNEEKFIARTITGAQKYVDRVLVVDDGSADTTSEIAQKLGAIVVLHPKNCGYGAAIRSIFEKACFLRYH